MNINTTTQAIQFTEKTGGEGVGQVDRQENCAASPPSDFLSQSGEIADIYGKEALEDIVGVADDVRAYSKVEVAKTLGVAVKTLEEWCKEMPRKIRRKRGVSEEGLKWLEGKIQGKSDDVATIPVVDIAIAAVARKEDVKLTERYAIVSRRGKVPRNTRLVIVSEDKEVGDTYLAICKDNRGLRPGLGLWLRKDGDMWSVVCFGKAAELKRMRAEGKVI